MQSNAAHLHWIVLQCSLETYNAKNQWRLVLFINDKLPLRASKAHPHLGSLLCPSCQWEPKTPTHFLECKHPEQKTLFTKLKAGLTAATQKLRMHLCMLTALWLGLVLTRHGTPYPDILHKVLPQLCYPIQHQMRLGWNQIYQGRISIGWAKAINITHPELALSSEQVMTQLIRIIWTFILDLWKVRNTHLHQPTKQLNLPKYRQAIVNLSEQHQQLPPDAQAALYHQPLEVLLEQPAPRLQTWAQRGMRYFNQQLRAAKSQAKLHTPDIRTFFGQQAQPIDNLQPPWETLLHWTSVGLLCTQ